MFDNIMNFFKKLVKKEKEKNKESSDTAKERLHLVLMQDRANVSADFLELMRQEIIEVIKKYDYPGNAADEVAKKLGIDRNEVGFIYKMFDPVLFSTSRLETIKKMVGEGLWGIITLRWMQTQSR